MASEHLSAEVLGALDRGADIAGAAREVLNHLLACPECRRRLKELQSPLAAEGEVAPTLPSGPRRVAGGEAYRAAFEAARQMALQETQRVAEEAVAAPMLLAELDRYKSSQQRLLIRNAPRFHNLDLIRLLLDRCRRGWAEDPVSAEQDAAAACEILAQLEADGFRLQLINDLRAESWGYLGNCRRICFDLRGAALAFELAEQFWLQGTGDLREKAQLLDLEVSFLRERREFDRAFALLEQVAEAYRSLRDHHMVGRALVSKAKLSMDRAEFEAAIPMLLEAAGLVDAERDPCLRMMLEKNLMLCLIGVGRLSEARVHLPEVRRLVRAHGNRLDRLRALWVEGLLRRELGELELAEEVLRRAQAGFLAANMTYDAALVSLDLGLLYLRSGRVAEVQALAAECYAVASSNAVEREALAALLVFHQAVEQEVATVSLVKDLISSVQRTPSVAHLRERDG